MKTIEEITAAMKAISDLSDAELTNEKLAEFDSLENELKDAQRVSGMRNRSKGYTTVVTPAGVPSATPRAEDPMGGLRNYLLTGKGNADLIRNDQSEGVPSQGGYLVPDLFRQKLQERLKAFGGISTVAEHYTTGNGNPVDWPTIDDTGNVGEVVEENGTFSSGADLAFGSNALGAYSYMTGGSGGSPLRVSRELLQDTSFDIMGLLTRLLGTRLGRIQAVHWATGSGVKQPLGLFTGRTPQQNAANTGIAYADLVNAIHAIDQLYRGNARWVMADQTLAQIELLTDSNGNPIYRGRDAAMAVGLNEATLLGYPVTIDQACPAFVKNSPTVQWGAFGDIAQGYVIRDVANVELLVNPYNRMANRQVEFTAWARADGTQQDTNAYVTLSGHT